MRQSLALINKALKAASYKKNWPVLVREWNFPTVPQQGDYDLPPDFHHLVAPSAWSADQYYQIKGSLTPVQWYRYFLNGGINFPEGFRIDPFGKKFKIAPVPGTAHNMVFMYVTKLIAKDGAGVPIEQYYQDTDEALIEEELVDMGLTWRWREKKGMDYSAELAEYNGTLNTRYAQQMGLGEVPIGGKYLYDAPLTQPTVPPVFGV
jgi:hypothetical protein